MKRSPLRALLVSTALIAAACGGESQTATSTDSVATSQVDGMVATVSGGQFDLGSLEGQDTVLWFWAPW